MNTTAPTSPWLPRLQAAGLALLFEAAHLSWEAAHGGIRVHHFMQRADMPALHNSWGLLLLPLLAAWALARGQRRGATRWSWARGFGLALLAGGMLSAGFQAGAQSFTAAVFFGSILGAALLPAYRAECLLGWVLGMSWTFGALLPCIIGLGLVALSALVQGLLWPWARGTWLRLRSS